MRKPFRFGGMVVAGLLLARPVRAQDRAEASGNDPESGSGTGQPAETVLRGEFRERYEEERLQPWGLVVLELTVGFGAGAFRTGDVGWGIAGIASRVAGGTGLGLVIAGQQPGPGVNEAVRIPGFVALGLGIAGCWATRIAVPAGPTPHPRVDHPPTPGSRR